MKIRFALTLCATLIGLACSSFADPALSPEQTFIAFRDAFAAKDQAKVLALASGTEAEMTDLKAEVDKTPAGMLEAIKSASVVDTHVEGDAAVILVSMTSPEKMVIPMFLTLKDNKWLVVKSPEGVNPEKVPALKKWAEEHQKPEAK